MVMSVNSEPTSPLFGYEVGRTDQIVTVEPMGSEAYGSSGVAHCAEFAIGQTDNHLNSHDVLGLDGLSYASTYHTVGPDQIEIEF